MSDDEPPQNVVQLPRIGSLPPPEAPPAPVLTPEEPEPAQGPEHVRISAFDGPPVAVAPSPERAAAAFRSEGTDPGPGDAGPPRPGALSMAAVLAIALAAFEGIRTWVQEVGPRRAEAAKHQRELELLAAKADADAARYAAQADSERAKAHRNRTVQPAHEYGRNTLQRRSGGSGQRSGPGGPAGPRKGPSGPHSGSGRTSGPSGRNSGPRGTFGQTSSPRASGGGGGSGRQGQGNGGGGGGSGRHRGDGNGHQGGGSGWFSRLRGGGKSDSSGGSGTGGGRSGSSGDGRTVAPQAVRDAVRQALTKPLKTFQSKKDKPKPPKQPKGGVNRTMPGETGASTTGAGEEATTSKEGRTAFWQAVGETLTGRWKQRRHTPPYATVPPRAKKAGRGAGPKAKHSKARQDTGSGAQGSAWRFRSSPWDAPGPESDEGPLKATSVRLDGGPGSQEKPRWQPEAVTTRQRALPRTGPAALPRAPQRPAGQRPGTTRRKEAIPMEPVQPAAATLTAPGGMAARHATEVTVDDVLGALAALTTQGMETHDDSAELAQAARRLLAELEAMAADLAEHHNVTGARTTAALQQLVETVTHLMVEAEQMARAALDAAELAEAEEAAMGRDYRPMADETADAGLATPSARLHNDN
ncbi:hypothetical protein [Streptomyces sp. URMC 125]|uniref:hypothetical protein n=1 Tax=Streptomyces sp. URMC 125 TaxID=3423419 RepID=UPI003F1A76A8